MFWLGAIVLFSSCFGQVTRYPSNSATRSPTFDPLSCSPLSEIDCFSRDACMWNLERNACTSVLPCAFESSSSGCARNTWNCQWSNSNNRCSKVLTSAPIQTVCSSIKTQPNCQLDKTCVWSQNSCKLRPTIVLSLADDLGWYDVEWNNPRSRTPVLNAMRSMGVDMQRHYTARFCAPTRAMLLTGLLPWKLGLQTDLNLNPVNSLHCSSSQAALGKHNVRLLPQLLKTQGAYETHMLGKWHLGHSKDSDLPTNRGFDSFIGYYGGGIENQDFGPDRFKAKECACPTKKANGNGVCKSFNTVLFCTTQSEMVNDTQTSHRVINSQLVEEESGELFLANQASKIVLETSKDAPLFLFLSWTAPHNPVFAPQRFIDKLVKTRPAFSTDAFINQLCSSDQRLIHLAMVSMLDEAHRIVVDALEASQRFANTLFVFLSDNGGNSGFMRGSKQMSKCSYGYNYPLRGAKFTWWEGGIRTVGFTYKVGILPGGNSRLISATDWKSTLMDGAGLLNQEKDDSFSRFNSLYLGQADEIPPREELVLQAWKEEDRFVILFRFENQLYKVIRGYPWSGLGAGLVGTPDKLHGGGQLFQPPELATKEMDVVEDLGIGKRCVVRPCLFNLDVDPSELQDQGGVAFQKLPVTLHANALIQKYRNEVGLVKDSGLCASWPLWYAKRDKDTTDKRALLHAMKCGGFQSWLLENGKPKLTCGVET